MPRLRAESKKRAARRDERNEVRRAVYLRQNGRCAAFAAPGRCTTSDQVMTDVHEIVSRARGGDPYTNDLLQVVGLCRAHHSWFTDNPYEAELRGFSLPSWAGDAMKAEAHRTRVAYWGSKPTEPPAWWLTKPERMEWWKSNQD